MSSSEPFLNEPGVPARALWFVGDGSAELRDSRLSIRPDDVVVRTLWSTLSRGTERLVFEGRVPASEHERMACPGQEGNFGFPVKYGYCAVGTVEQGSDDLVGRTVFALNPHQTRFALSPTLVSLVPDNVPARRAVLAANMETALNGLWDSNVGPGDRIVVIGAGIVGLLVGYLASRLPGADVTVVDPDERRASVASALGLDFVRSLAPGCDADMVIHASASAAGLCAAIDACGFEATLVEMSWYGDGTIPVPLGGAFHSRRLRMISSQVGSVAKSHRPRWSHKRRLAKALSLLNGSALDALITDEIAFDDLPDAIPRLLAPGAPGLAVAIRY